MSLAAAVECLLFVSGEPLALADIARALQCDELVADEAVRALRATLDERASGLDVLQIAGGYQLATRSEHAETIGRLLTRGVNKLSRAALETLAIVAYRQPITIPEIEAVRGVAAGGVMKTLLDKRLVAEVGRKQTVGRPALYATTQEFLHYFAINDLNELPPLEEGEAEAVAALEERQDAREAAEETPEAVSLAEEPSLNGRAPLE